MKALVHVNESHKWQMALSNLKNLKKEQSITDIAWVLNGEAVELVTNPSNIDGIMASIEIYICNNSLAQREIAPDSLASIYQVVPSGVVKIVELQGEGFRYIKP